MCKGKTFYVNDVTARGNPKVKTRYHPDNDRTIWSFKVKDTLFLREYETGYIEAIIGGKNYDNDDF